jgi:Ca2+-binding RTX toxin-like protein
MRTTASSRTAPSAGDPGRFDADLPAFYPTHGYISITIAITGCTNPADDEDTSFQAYIDPSGTVTDTAGHTIAGATVTLYRSDASAGPFTEVTDGSAVMSPANRHNPDTSDSDGHFGWDVIAGFYKVRVAKSGCHAAGDPTTAYAESDVLTIPPAVTDLALTLDCGETPPPPDPCTGAGVIHGTPGDDLIHGTSGDDVICGLGGKDVIYGGAGNDVVYGGDGNDHLFGQSGDDTLHGGAGKDSLAGNKGNNTMFGDDGNDTISGDVGADHLDGGAGDDVLKGMAGNDTITGGAGHDAMLGATGDDALDSADGIAEAVQCATGVDTADVDALDTVTGCESVTVH